jgi:hypothetical protein
MYFGKMEVKYYWRTGLTMFLIKRSDLPVGSFEVGGELARPARTIARTPMPFVKPAP